MNERLKRYLLKIWKYALLVLLILVGYILYNYTNLFVVSDYKLIPLNADTFVNVNAEELLSLEILKNEQRYFSLDIEKIKGEVLGSSSFIKSTYITKEFPNSAFIYIQERYPFITLEIESKRCVVLDAEGFVLELLEEQCANSTQKYKSIEVKSDDPKIIFTLNTKSNYFQIKKIADVVKVMNQYKVPVVSIRIIENVVTITSTKNKQYIFSFNQDLDTQLARFLSVLGQLEKKKYSYKEIDFRFKRPVLTIK